MTTGEAPEAITLTSSRASDAGTSEFTPFAYALRLMEANPRVCKRLAVVGCTIVSSDARNVGGRVATIAACEYPEEFFGNGA